MCPFLFAENYISRSIYRSLGVSSHDGNERTDENMSLNYYFTDDAMRNMGKRIQEERKKKGYKAIDFADIIGIGKDQLSRIENGKVPCKIEYVYTIASTLCISTDYLIFGTGVKKELDDILWIVENDSNKIKKLVEIARVVFGE